MESKSTAAGSPASSAAVPAGLLPSLDVVGRRFAQSLGLTCRQWQVALLMADRLVDEVIAGRLGLSVRTVRSEISTMLRVLQTTSRFAAGVAVGRAAATADMSRRAPRAPQQGGTPHRV